MKYNGVEFKTITNIQFEEIVKSLAGLSFRIFRIKYARDLEKMDISKLKLFFSQKQVDNFRKDGSFTEDQLSRYSEIYDNWETVFEPAIKEELSRFKIRFKTKKEEDSEIQNKANGDELTGDQEGTADELGKHTKEVGEISIKNNALSEVKMWVAALPNLKFDTVNGKQTLVSVRNSLLGMATTVNYDKAWTLISTAFAHCNEFNEMLDEAAKLGKDNAFFKTVYTSLSQLLKAAPNETLEDKLYRENMQTMIRNTFSKHTMEYIFCLVENIDGTATMYLKNENRNATTSNVIKEWLNNLIDNSGLVVSFSGGFLPNKKNKDGSAYNQNYEKIVKDIKSEFAILSKDAVNKKIDDSNVTDYARRTVSLIQKIGIDIDEKVLDQFLKDTFDKTSRAENLTAFLTTVGPGTFEAFVSYRLDDLKNIGFDGSFKISKRQSSLEQLIKDDKFVKQLAEAYAKVNPSETEITVRTTDGKILQTITEKNYLTDHTNDLNRSLEEVKAHNQTAYISGNTISDKRCKGSRLIDSLLKGLHYKVCTITGFKELGSNDQGRRYKEISQLEDYVMKLTLVHNNYMLLPTMGDSVRYDVLYSNAIKSLDSELSLENGKTIVSLETLNRFVNYFETELETIQYNYQHQPTEDKDKIKNYDTGARNGYRLRHFNGIELPFTNKDGSKLNINEDLRKAEESNVNIIDTILEEWNKLEQFQKYEIMNKFLMKQLVIDLNSAQKLGIITWDGKNLQSVKNVALPGNLLKDFSYLPEVSLISEFCFNHMSSLIEFEKVYTGDIAYYKNPEDYTKRLREVLSTGITPRTQYEAGSEMNALREFNVATFKDNEYPSRQINEIIQSAKTSYIYKLLQKNGYNNKEIKQMISENKVEPEVIEQATILAETNFKGYRKVNQTDATVLLSPEGYKQLARRFFGWKPEIAEAFDYLNSLEAITDENVEQYQKSLGTLIKPLKCMYFGVNRNAALRREIPIFDKMAMFPVFPLLATGDMKMVLDKMNDPKNPIHMIAFESAVKVGQDVKSSMYEDDGITLNEESLSDIVTHKQSLNNFRWQMSTDPHTSHEQMFVTQALKAAILNVRQSNVYTTQSGETVTGKQLLKTLFDCLNQLSIRGSKKLLKKYGIKEGKFSKEKAYKNIYDSAKASHMNQNVLEALQDTNIPLSGISNSAWIEASIISDINSEVIDITTPGGMFIQMSSVTYNGLTIRGAEGMRSLRFNREDNSVECCVSINLLKSIIPDYDKKTFKQAKDWLIKHGVIGNDKPAMSMGYRIPAQGPSSVVALTVVDVYPEQIGDTITLPDEWTILTGSGFGGDRLFIARYNYDKNGNIIRLSNTSKIDKTKNVIQNLLNLYNQETIFNLTENEQSQNRLNKLMFEHWCEELGNPNTNEELELIMESTEAIENRMLEMLIASVTESTQYAESRLPLDDLTLYLTKTVLKDIDELKGITSIKHNQIYFISPAYQNEVKGNLMSGIANIAPAAFAIPHHSLSQAVNLVFNNKQKNIAKYGLTNLHKIDSDFPLYHRKDSSNHFISISDWLSTMFSAHVDIAKDPYIYRLNVRKLTINTVNLLLRTGKGESTFYFMSQPILVDLANEYDKYSGSYGIDKTKSSIENTIIDNIFKKYVKEYDKTYTKEIFDDSEATLAKEAFDIDFLRKQMDEKTERNSEWYKNQLEILKVYIELQPAARALSECVNVSQIDTKKFGNNFALQQKFLLKMHNFFANKTMLENAKDIISETFLKDKLIYGLLESRKQFSGILLRTTPEFEQLRAIIYSKINDVAYLNEKTINNVTCMMEASFKIKIITDIFKRNNPKANTTIWLINLLYDISHENGKNYSVPSRFAKFKKDVYAGKYPDLLNSDGTLNNSLLENFYEQAVTSKEDLILPRKLVFTKNHTNDERLEDHIIRAWEGLLDYHNPEVRQLAEDLIYWAMFTSGDGFGISNLFKYVPHSWRKSSGYYEAIDSLEKNPENLSLMIDINSVFLNLWWNDQVIPPISWQKTQYDIEGNSYLTPKKGITVSWFKQNGRDLRIYANKKRVRVPKSIELNVPEIKNQSPFAKNKFKPYIKIDLGTKNNPNSTFVYKLIGHKTDAKGNIKGVYVFHHKRGYNYKGGVFVEPAYHTDLNTPANFSLLLAEYNIISDLNDIDLNGVVDNNNLSATIIKDYTKDLEDYFTGKSNKIEHKQTVSIL